MNTNTTLLFSSTSNHIERLDSIEFEDLTTLSIVLSGVYSGNVPLYLKISWGDGEMEIFDNDIYEKIYGEVAYNGGILPLFSKTYTHIYYPSSTSLYKPLSAQVLVEYPNNEKNWFTIPIRIRTYNYSESVGEMTLINTNIIPDDDNNKEYQFNIDRGDYVVEIRES